MRLEQGGDAGGRRRARFRDGRGESEHSSGELKVSSEKPSKTLKVRSGRE